MKLQKNHEIERLVSDDISRPHLTMVHYDVERSIVVATNGHCLAVVPVTTDEGDVTGFITPDAIRMARKVAAKGDDVSITASGHLGIPGGVTLPRPVKADIGNFPRYEQVIPAYREGDPGTVTVVLDHRYLAQLFEALGGGKRDGIRLTIKIPPTKDGDEWAPAPVVIGVGPKTQPDGRIGVLMPIAP